MEHDGTMEHPESTDVRSTFRRKISGNRDSAARAPVYPPDRGENQNQRSSGKSLDGPPGKIQQNRIPGAQIPRCARMHELLGHLP